jgi:hypothetical protein
MRLLSAQLKKYNRGWNIGSLHNLACEEFLTSFPNKNRKEIDGLLDRYKELRDTEAEIK